MEDTEWNDILREKGILPPKEVEFTEEKLVDMMEQVIKEKTTVKWDEKTLEELDELEDEEDDEFIQQYRLKRIAEMKENAKSELFGDVKEISKPDFVREVTEASNDAPVVVLLYDSNLEQSRIVEEHFKTVASKFKATKFVKIRAILCIPNYPDRNVPTLLLYDKGDVVGQIVGLASLGGLTMKASDLELTLQKHKMIRSTVQ